MALFLGSGLVPPRVAQRKYAKRRKNTQYPIKIWEGDCIHAECKKPYCLCRPCHPLTLNPVESIPQSFCCNAGGLKRPLCRLRIAFHRVSQLLFPHPRMIDVGGRMQVEVLAGLRVRGIHLLQPAEFLSCYPRHLRFVGIESCQRLFWSASEGS